MNILSYLKIKDISTIPEMILLVLKILFSSKSIYRQNKYHMQ